MIATSVFTHLLAPAADQYLAEAARVLAPAGRLFCTWMLLGDEQRGSLPARFVRLAATMPALVADPAVPEAAVAYNEEWLRERLGAHDLELRTIYPGSCRGRSGASHQDIVVAVQR